MAWKIAPDATIDFLHVFDVILEEEMRLANINDTLLHVYHIEAEEKARLDLNRFVEDIAGDRSISRKVTFGYPGHVLRACGFKQARLNRLGKAWKIRS
jgi:hypothetical protein